MLHSCQKQKWMEASQRRLDFPRLRPARSAPDSRLRRLHFSLANGKCEGATSAERPLAAPLWHGRMVECRFGSCGRGTCLAQSGFLPPVPSSAASSLCMPAQLKLDQPLGPLIAHVVRRPSSVVAISWLAGTPLLLHTNLHCCLFTATATHRRCDRQTPGATHARQESSETITRRTKLPRHHHPPFILPPLRHAIAPLGRCE